MTERIRLYADEHVPRAVIRGLRSRGVDVLTLKEIDMLGASDVEHVQRALMEERVIVTQDADFLRLHAADFEHAELIFAPLGTSVGAFLRGIMLIIAVLSPAEMRRHVEFI